MEYALLGVKFVLRLMVGKVVLSVCLSFFHFICLDN